MFLGLQKWEVGIYSLQSGKDKFLHQSSSTSIHTHRAIDQNTSILLRLMIRTGHLTYP